MKITQLETAITETLKYSDLKSGDEFTMGNNTLRIKTNTGHVAFEDGHGGTSRCVAYLSQFWINHTVVRVKATIQWWRL